MSPKSKIPSLITLSRLMLSPAIVYTYLNGEYMISLLIFVFAACTDFFDGYIAREMDSETDSGAFLDVLSDFILIISCFSAFIARDLYNPLILVLIILMFAIFMATSNFNKPIYDPVGKYLGSYLMLMIIVTFLFPGTDIIGPLQLSFVLFCIVSITSRLVFLGKSVNA
ncbi:CDP-alcohol phosphatidyltransferase family protein [Methanobacterium alcaliphilum]|uniref:CDP-alcohol phosphatidyltransferase family protein n=1 Tax=Methanobacterium alcaliphilum TaxID=392018 RepID=UPI00200B43FB|nr:CDP-alcohol phosphatidyltransferase family protein [Methanobacterium alcaliphilum]MCK9152251.1 CDP-alcohol phosphatidyltransferase family protein [Methanobacterium alcaliphilum]